MKFDWFYPKAVGEITSIFYRLFVLFRCDLSSTTLFLKRQRKDMDNDLNKFDFISRPTSQAVQKSIASLVLLGVLKEDGSLKEARIGELPVEPHHARILLEATKSGCADQIFGMVAMLSAEHIFVKPRDPAKQEQAQLRHQALTNEDGDHFTMIDILREFVQSEFLT